MVNDTPKTLSECLIDINKDNERLRYGLFNIWFNVYKSKSSLFNSSILACIENAVGSEKIEYWKKQQE